MLLRSGCWSWVNSGWWSGVLDGAVSKPWPHSTIDRFKHSCFGSVEISNIKLAGWLCLDTILLHYQINYGPIIIEGWISHSPFGLLVRDHLALFRDNDNDWSTFSGIVAYGLQVSMNAEEGLYWSVKSVPLTLRYWSTIRYHLMRAVRRPKSAKSWLTSSFFITWIGITIVSFLTQYCVAWIGEPDMETQMARMFVSGGVIELLSVFQHKFNVSLGSWLQCRVCLTASMIIFKFPAFLEDVVSNRAREVVGLDLSLKISVESFWSWSGSEIATLLLSRFELEVTSVRLLTWPARRGEQSSNLFPINVHLGHLDHWYWRINH